MSKVPLKLPSFLEKSGERLIENLGKQIFLGGRQLICSPLSIRSSSWVEPTVTRQQTPRPVAVDGATLMEGRIWSLGHWELPASVQIGCPFRCRARLL